MPKNRTLIIPDIHNKYDIAESIIHKENPDNVVFLGDYFDSYYDTLENTEQTAQWLKESIEKENRIHLLGNHDLSYLDKNFYCPGFSEGKLFVIKKTGVDLTKLQYYCWVGDWLCTHAGLTNDFFSAYNYKNLSIEKFLDNMIENNSNRLYDISCYRGGTAAHAGILWCDYDEFIDIPDVKQIFGHTRGPLRQTKNHVCLDTALQNYAIYENDHLVIEVR